MEIKTVSYRKTFNLGNYSNEQIGVDIALAPNEDPLEAFAEAKKTVEKSHRFFKELPDYEMAKKIVATPDDHTGRSVKQAEDVINAFEYNYPDYLQKFSMPFSRQLNQPEEKEEELNF